MSFYIPCQLVKLATITASNSASISFTSLINSNFSTYLIKGITIVPGTNVTNLNMVFSTNNGSSYLSSNYKYAYILGAASNGLGGSDSTSSILVNDTTSNSASSYMNFDCFLFDMNSSSVCPKSMCQGTNLASTTGEWTFISGMNTTTTPVNAVQMSMSSGNIASGTFILYGVSEP